MATATPDRVQELQRWVDFGGVWRVVDRRPGEVTVSLCRCDGGEEVQRLTCGDEALLTYLADKESSADLPSER